jgi:NADH:ubiquinone oxidoreductase subunit K
MNKRNLIVTISAIEVLISAAILLIVFGFFPIDISGLNIPRSTVIIVAGVWFLSSLGILIYMLTKTDTTE